MLIIGAKGFAKEVLEVCRQNNELGSLCFYDDVNKEFTSKLFGQFAVLKNIEEARNYFKTVDSRFTIGIGKPLLRKMLCEKFEKHGGKLTSTISRKADIGSYDIEIGDGANILDGVKISNSVKIGIAPIIYYNSIIAHDCLIGDYVEISPGATLLGRAEVGNNVQVGAGSIILPDLKVGSNTIIGAGSVVTKSIPDNCTVVGVPAKIIKSSKLS